MASSWMGSASTSTLDLPRDVELASASASRDARCARNSLRGTSPRLPLGEKKRHKRWGSSCQRVHLGFIDSPCVARGVVNHRANCSCAMCPVSAARACAVPIDAPVAETNSSRSIQELMLSCHTFEVAPPFATAHPASLASQRACSSSIDDRVAISFAFSSNLNEPTISKN